MAIVAAQPETSLLQGFEDRFQPFSGFVRLGHGSGERTSHLQERTFRVGGVRVETELLSNGRFKHLALYPA